MNFVFDDGGRSAHFKGKAGDCGVRAAAIACDIPYKEVYDAINALAEKERPRKAKRSNARSGVHARTLGRFLLSKGFKWTPTMQIGSGVKVHLRDGELPAGRIVARVSKHFTAVVDGVIRDTHDPSRQGTRCVYGYWIGE